MKKKGIYLLGLVLLVIWMAISTPFIAYTNGGNKVKKISFDKIPQKDVVWWAISRVSEKGNLAQTYTIEGHAFIDRGSEEDNPDRKVSLVLRSESVCYEISTELFWANINYLFLQNPRGPGHWGYAVGFSTPNIENGTYDLFIRCSENDTIYGLADTGYQITKQNGRFIRHPARGTLLETQIAPTQDEPFSVAIDTAAITETGLTIKGWAVVPEQDCTDRREIKNV